VSHRRGRRSVIVQLESVASLGQGACSHAKALGPHSAPSLLPVVQAASVMYGCTY
jgi:hypothetical protein